MENIFNRFPLLPNYFKKIALVLLMGTFVFIVLKAADIISIDKKLWIFLVLHGILIAFLFLAFSKDKFEDELIAQIRFRALAIALLFGTLFFLLSSISAFVLKSKSQPFNPFILYMIFMYYFWVFYRMKKLRVK